MDSVPCQRAAQGWVLQDPWCCSAPGGLHTALPSTSYGKVMIQLLL